MASFSQSPRLKIFRAFLILPLLLPALIHPLLCQSDFLSTTSSFLIVTPQRQATNSACLDNDSNKLLNVSLLLSQIDPIYICHYTARLNITFTLLFLCLKRASLEYTQLCLISIHYFVSAFLYNLVSHSLHPQIPSVWFVCSQAQMTTCHLGSSSHTVSCSCPLPHVSPLT